MGFWMIVAMIAISLTISYLATKDLQQEGNTTEPGEIEAPTAKEGKNVAVLFGTKRIKGPNVVWYGDIKTTAIKK